MAKQKRLNKNLVAFLTVMGMLLAVSIAGLAIRQGAQRDPEVLARSARDLEGAGEPEKVAKAAGLYRQAYNASRNQNTAYLLDSARCMFQVGALDGWLAGLRRGLAEHPDDQALMVAALDGLWSLRDIEGLARWGDMWRELSDSLLAVDPENTLGLASRALGLWASADEKQQALGDEAAEKAFAAHPQDPRAALAYVQYVRRQMATQFANLRTTGATENEFRAAAREAAQRSLDALRGAVAAHPAHVAVATTCAAMLDGEARRIRIEDASRTAESGALLAEANALLQRALEENPGAAELHLALAEHLREELRMTARERSPEEADQLLAQIQAAAQRAVELEPALYEARSLAADVHVLRPDFNQLDAPERLRRYVATLDAYANAVQETRLLRGLRAGLTEGRRLLVLHRAFTAALATVGAATEVGDEAQSDAALEQARTFLEDAQTKWPEHALTDYMQAKLFILDDDLVAAITALERAHRKQPNAQWWFQGVGAPNLPADHLAMLYQRQGQIGTALEYAELAIRQYRQDLGRVPPNDLLIARIEIFGQLERLREALELVDEFARDHPTDGRTPVLRATLRTRLAQSYERQAAELEQAGDTARAADLRAQATQLQAAARAEAGTAVDAAAGTDRDLGVQLWQAQIAAEQRDYASAEEQLRAILNDERVTDRQFESALTVLSIVMQQADRREAALQFVQELLAKPARPGVADTLRQYQALLSESDPQKRDERLLAVLQQVSDPAARAEQLYSYYFARRQYEQAAPYLAELRRLRPDDIQYVERQFSTYVALGQLDDADRLVATLAQYDEGRGADHAGGATYRGSLALARGDADLAIRELRKAAVSLPRSAELQVLLGRACLRAQRASEAIEAFKRAAEINPRSPDAHGYLTTAYDALAANALGAERDTYVAEAARHFEVLSRLAPNDPFVLRRRERAAEDADPLAAITRREQTRQEKPADIENLVRLAELYRDAWPQAQRNQDAAAQQQLIEQAALLFAAFPAEADENDALGFAQSAAMFYAASKQRQTGEEYLTRFRDQQNGSQKIRAQILLARFLEALGDVLAAERAYQDAQRLVGEAITDPDARPAEDLRVGLACAEFHERGDRAPQVIEVCRWMLDRLPNTMETLPRVRLKLVNALLMANRLSEAEAEIETYIQTHQEDLPVLIARAQLWLRKNERERAQDDLTTILRTDPENLWARTTRGDLLLRRGRYEEAREDLVQARALAPPRSPWELRVRALLATLYERLGQVDLAVEQLRAQLGELEARRAPPEEIGRIVDELVRLLRRFNQLDRAQQLISEYMEKHPEQANWPYQLGQVLEARAEAAQAKNDTTGARREYASAARYYQRAAEKVDERRPADLVAARAAQIRALTQAGQARDALALFSSLPFAQPPPMLRLAAAPAYWEQNERPAALEQWRLALLDASGASTGSLTSVANDIRQRLLAGDVEALLREVADRVPPESKPGQRLRILLADQLSRAGKASEALPALTSLLERLEKDSPEYLTALVTRGMIEEAAGNSEGAVAAYRQALEQHPDHVVAINNLAYLLVTGTGPGFPRPEEALRYAEQLETLVSGDANAANLLDTVGWVYFKYGTSGPERGAYVERAVAALEQARGFVGDADVALLYHLGQAYAAVGRAADARAAYGRGLELSRRTNDATWQQRFEQALAALP